jgi:hypothetical protein
MAHKEPSAVLAGIHAGDGWRHARNLLGGLLILAVWLSLWAWMAFGVARPLSAVPAAPAAPELAAGQRS